MRKIYIVTLTDTEVALLEDILNKGKHAAQKRKRAFALLHAHKGAPDRQISEANGMTINAIQLLRQRFVEHGFEATLAGLPKQARQRVLDGNAEAHLVALACSEKPAGHKRWTLRILAERLVALGCVEEVSHETIRQVLKKTKSNPGSGWNGAFPQSKTPNSWRTWRTYLMSINDHRTVANRWFAWMNAQSS